MNDTELAREIAETAGRLLIDVRNSKLFSGKILGKAGDQIANAFIMQALRANRPDDAILSEEEKDNAARLHSGRVWIVDPLDGTREYGEARADWAVHVALAVDGVATLGAVALPGLPLTLSTDQPLSRPHHTGKLRMLVSRTRPAAEAVAVAEALGAELIPMGSAGAKAMAVVRGEADIYLHSGGQYEWDSCAPVAVAKAAGLHTSRIDGSALRYNQPDTLLPDLLVCPKEYAARVIDLVARHSS
jgi:3'(2'), 5'-bisphosphate nucleotidase